MLNGSVLLAYTFKEYAYYTHLNFCLNLENIIAKFLCLSYGLDQEYDIEPDFYHKTPRGFVIALKWLVLILHLNNYAAELILFKT